jgi:hypothetical protein
MKFKTSGSRRERLVSAAYGAVISHFQKPEETAIELNEKLFRSFKLPECAGSIR